MTNSNATRTTVPKSAKPIKTITTATFPAWKGRRVTVVEAESGWYHLNFNEDRTEVRFYNLRTGEISFAERPRYAGPAVQHRAIPGFAVVMLSMVFGCEIVLCPFDAAVMTVAVDTALEKPGYPCAIRVVGREHVSSGMALELFCVVAAARGAARSKLVAVESPS